MGARDRIARRLRDRSGGRLTAVAKPMHTASIYALGHGAGELPVTESGERHPLQLLGDRPAPVIFDVGAFRGEYARLARSILGHRAIIHCFEPNADRGPDLVTAGASAVHQIAVAGVDGPRTLYHDPGQPGMASLQRDASRALDRTPSVQASVDSVALDSFCAAQSIAHVDLLKLDVEGLELEALKGATELLTERRIGIVQFEFGYGNIASRTFIRDFYDLLGGSHAFYRVTPLGLVALGNYRLELEVFVSATNYAAVPRSRP